MKLDDKEPPRFDDAGPDALRALVRSHQTGPTDAIVERMSKRLDAALAASTPASEGLGLHVERRFVSYKMGVLALAIAGALVLSWRATHPEPSKAAIASVPAPSEASPKGQPAATTNVPESPSVGPGEAPAAISVDQLPSAAPIPAAAPSATSVRPSSGGNVVDRDSSTELDVIQRAQTALGSDPRRALAITNEHARTYPSGEFVQEREVIAVEALAKMGRQEEAERRAFALAHAFPNTPYATRLAKAIGRPIAPRPSPTEPSLANP